MQAIEALREEQKAGNGGRTVSGMSNSIETLEGGVSVAHDMSGLIST